MSKTAHDYIVVIFESIGSFKWTPKILLIPGIII